MSVDVWGNVLRYSKEAVGGAAATSYTHTHSQVVKYYAPQPPILEGSTSVSYPPLGTQSVVGVGVCVWCVGLFAHRVRQAYITALSNEWLHNLAVTNTP